MPEAGDLPIGGVAVHAVHSDRDDLALAQRGMPQPRVRLQAPHERGRGGEQAQRLLERRRQVRKGAPAPPDCMYSGMYSGFCSTAPVYKLVDRVLQRLRTEGLLAMTHKDTAWRAAHSLPTH